MQQQIHAHPLAFLFVAAPEDGALLAQWETHLQPLLQMHLISAWSEQHAVAGTSLDQERPSQLAKADFVLLLLSAYFFASPNCCEMMEQALKRSQTGMVRVIPLLLRPVAWEESPLRTLAPWPSNRKPITLWSNQDEGWHACIQELRHLLGRQGLVALTSGRSANPDWGRMLRLLRRSYRKLLDQSLHGIAWVELGLSTRPDLVSNVTNLLFRRSQGHEYLIAPDTSMLDVYDEAEGELLILGAPGAGKSTLLLHLAQHLVDRAFADEVSLLPIILRLSSWALGQPALAEWMVEQFAQTYNVPHTLAERWVTEGRVLPLLDGLDEMEEAARPLCIAAINAYHRTHLVPLVVCSRQAEYETVMARERLTLQNAVIVQPLSDEQIESSLSLIDSSFAGVRIALHQPALRNLATTPLMLSILLLTYRGTLVSEINQHAGELEKQVWTDYVARQVREKGNDVHYPLEQTHSWLTFLAQQMQAHQQTTFYAEYIQTDWLPSDQQRTVIGLTVHFPAILLGICVSLLVLLFLFPGTASVLFLQMGLLGGFIGDSLIQHSVAEAEPRSQKKQRKLRRTILFGLLLAAGLYLQIYPVLRSNPSSIEVLVRYCILYGLGGGLSFWIFQRILRHRPGIPMKKVRSRPSRLQSFSKWLTKIALPPVWWGAAVLGGEMGLAYGLIIGLPSGPIIGPTAGASYGLSYGLSISLTIMLVHVILAGSMRPLRLAEHIQWTWRSFLQRKHLRNSLLTTGALFLLYWLIGGLSYEVSYVLVTLFSYSPLGGPSYEMNYVLGAVLSYRLSYGLSIGLSYGLSYWVVMGLYQGMKQGHLQDQDRHQFNQGIRRSFRNGLLLGLVSTLLLSTLGVGLNSVLSSVLHAEPIADLSFGLVRLNPPLSIGTSLAYIFSTSLVILWALFGGLTVLRHYVIRWSLSRHRMFPWRAQAFLDDATSRILVQRVGGGYSFIHRRLQDYFADAVPPPSQN